MSTRQVVDVHVDNIFVDQGNGKQKKDKKILYYSDFSDYSPATGGIGKFSYYSDLSNFSTASGVGNFSYFTSGSTAGDDAVVTYDATNKYLDVNSATFSKTWTAATPDKYGALDHVKYLVFNNKPIDLYDDGSEIFYESSIACKQIIGTIPAALQPGITDPNADIRLGSGALNLIEYSSNIVFDLFLSNNTIYAYYERLPFNRSDYGGTGTLYQAFSYAIPIGHRNSVDPLSDFVKVAIGVNRTEGYVRYFVDDIEQFRINRIGYPLDRKYCIAEIGGTPEHVEPKKLFFGFGHFTLLDMTNPLNITNPTVADGGPYANSPLLQLGLAAGYVDPHKVAVSDGSAIQSTFLSTSDVNRLFNNGARTRLKYLRVCRS